MIDIVQPSLLLMHCTCSRLVVGWTMSFFLSLSFSLGDLYCPFVFAFMHKMLYVMEVHCVFTGFMVYCINTVVVLKHHYVHIEA